MRKSGPVGDKAPNFEFGTPWRKALDFHKEMGTKAAILIFLRYIGCPVCQMEKTKLKRNIGIAKNRNVGVFVVLQSSPDVAASACKEEDWQRLRN